MAKQPLQATDLPLKPVDPDSPIPLYHQVEADLRKLIETEVFTAGDVLPSEIELGEAYGVGRQTMRTALSRLMAAHLIDRKAGRGTMVRARPNRMQFYLDRSFTRQMADMGRLAHSKVLNASTGVIDTDSPIPLQTKLGAPCFHLSRLRFGDEEPIGLQYTTIITELCPRLPEYDFNHLSLYDVLLKDFSLVIAEIGHTIGAVTADHKHADLLKVTIGAPLLTVDTNVFLQDGQIIEFTNSYYRADKYEYRTIHTPD